MARRAYCAQAPLLAAYADDVKQSINIAIITVNTLANYAKLKEGGAA
jgi:hypothetical protein